MRPLPIVLASRVGRWVAFAALAALLWAICTAPTPAGLTPEGQRVLGVFVVCVVLWVTHLLPLMITGLLAMGLMPLLGVVDAREAFAGLSSPAVLFILGAFILAGATVQSRLSMRVALGLLNAVGGTPYRLAFGLMTGAMLLSLVMPAHAVAAMLFPIALQIVHALKLRHDSSPYARLLFLSLAWGAVIGGVGSLLGGARTPLAIAVLYDYTAANGPVILEISFLEWMIAAMPMVLVMLGCLAVVLRVFFPSEITSVAAAHEALRAELQRHGRWTLREYGVGFVLVSTIGCWILLGRRFGIAPIAVASVVTLFVLRLVTWDAVKDYVNWGIILMYGGAISLGNVMASTGAAEWVARQALGTGRVGPVALIAGLALLSKVLTEGISNTAVVALLLPLALTLGDQAGIPLEIIVFAVAVPAGLAFCLPMGTPATAIALASGYLRVRHIFIPGLVLSVISFFLFMAAVVWYFPLLGLELPQ